jgi:hypothetical protein
MIFQKLFLKDFLKAILKHILKVILKCFQKKMNKAIVCIILFFACITIGFSAYAENNSTQNSNNPMSGEFQEGANFANTKLPDVINKSKHTDPHSVPGFITDNPAETKDKVANIDDIAKQKNATDPQGQFIDKSYTTRQHPKIDKKDELVVTANTIVKGASDTEAKSGDYNGLSDMDTHYDPSRDFNQAVSALSGAASATKDITQHQNCHWEKHCHWHHLHRKCHKVKVCDNPYYVIFDGNGKSCRDYIFAYDNCCKDSGWGKKIGLAGCNETEHQLGLAKQAGVCHYVGKYCSKHIGHTHYCLMHSKSYCCFGSKLARIIQEQGRPQIGRGWGNSDNPDCSGFTPEQLQHIDFSKIDFRDFYNDLQQEEKVPDVGGTQGHADQKIQDDINRNKPM